MTEDEIWDLQATERIKKCHEKLNRNFLMIFCTHHYELITLMDASTEQIINEINYRKGEENFISSTNIIIDILEQELLFRRKEKISKIQGNILKKRNILLYLYDLIKKLYATKNKRKNMYRNI